MLRRWLIACALCCATALASIWFCDRAIADFAHSHSALHDALNSAAFKLPILQTVAVVMLLLGGVPADAKLVLRDARLATLQTGIAMTSAMVVNSILLKPLFGRAVPWLYVSHKQYGFYPLHYSTLLGSFPSGHAVLAAALAAVLWNSYPKSRLLCGAGVFALFVALVFGGYHYLSDLIVGAFVGASIGVLTMKMSDALIERERGAPVLGLLSSKDPIGLQTLEGVSRRFAGLKPLAVSREDITSV